MAKDLITAVIPTFNNRHGLERILGELDRAGVPAVVIINRRFTIQDLRFKNNPNVKIINPKHNLGFAGGVNRGAREARTEWILILNDDVTGITHKALKRLSAQALENSWSAAAPILLDPNGKAENMGYRVLPQGKVELNFDQTKITDKELDGLTAACLLIQRQVWERLGGLDERFFAYLEDVDLCLSLKEAGYHFGVVREVKVRHEHMATTSKLGKAFKAKQDLVNWWRLSFKHPQILLRPKYLQAFLVERGRNVSGYLKAILN